MLSNFTAVHKLGSCTIDNHVLQTNAHEPRSIEFSLRNIGNMISGSISKRTGFNAPLSPSLILE